MSNKDQLVWEKKEFWIAVIIFILSGLILTQCDK